MSDDFRHRPVMLDEVVALFATVPPGVVVDATVGGGGHARALLQAHGHLRLVGLDRDDAALTAAGQVLEGFGERALLRRARFDAMGSTLDALGIRTITGALFDLGVSSPQFDEPDRGFSYRYDAPLDMRMDRRQTRTAADVVNGYDQSSLARVLADYGDERFANRIAAALVRARPVTTTAELADLVKNAIPAAARRRGGHPAKRSFQALRIEVNGELDVLPVALDAAIGRLQPGGRCAVISYHSGEDRIAKDRLRHAVTGGCACPPQLPCACGARPLVRELRPRKRRPQAEEIAANPRAESAVLRAVEALPDDGGTR
jgi:16S rRNA (cytosine1402-N4)-methyltransferase